MSWIENFVRPKIRQLYRREVPDNLWIKCSNCGGMLFHRDLKAADSVCTECGHHMRLTARERMTLLFDDGQFEEVELPNVPVDPLRFRDRKRYTDRLREAETKTETPEAILVGHGQIAGQPAVIAAFNFDFMGGSMGMMVGEALVTAAQLAVLQQAAFIAVPASGGARMQEGILSLMQMPRSVIAVDMVKEAGLPYLVILTDPTTGGVSASFAMLGDIHIAEPGAQIGFAGKRVIEETIRETLPQDFQTAEYLLDHGMVDMVVPRRDLAATVGRILRLLMVKREDAVPQAEMLRLPSPKADTAEDATDDATGVDLAKQSAADTAEPLDTAAPPQPEAVTTRNADGGR